jgi:hypothetical protein
MNTEIKKSDFRVWYILYPLSFPVIILLSLDTVSFIHGILQLLPCKLKRVCLCVIGYAFSSQSKKGQQSSKGCLNQTNLKMSP